MPKLQIYLPEKVLDRLAWIADRRGDDLKQTLTGMVDEYISRERSAADCPMGGLAREFWPEMFSPGESNNGPADPNDRPLSSPLPPKS